MDDFKTITAHVCSYCKKVFRTRRHDCKLNPEKRNCFTCKHSEGFDIKSDLLECKHGYDYYLDDLKECSYNLCCDGWEQRKN